jgi:hypothetical protein
VYARPVRNPGRVGAVALVSALILGFAGCRSTTLDEQAASLCEDLLHLQATVTLLARPPADATVGQMRAALEKLDPTFDAVGRSSLVPDALRSQVVEGKKDYGDAMDGVGDDDPASEVTADVADARLRLEAAYSAVVGVLGCVGSSITPAP